MLDAGARLIGVNNRDLRTFVTRLEHTLELAEKMPAGRLPGQRERRPHPRRRGAVAGGRRAGRAGRRDADAFTGRRRQAPRIARLVTPRHPTFCGDHPIITLLACQHPSDPTGCSAVQLLERNLTAENTENAEERQESLLSYAFLSLRSSAVRLVSRQVLIFG